MGFGMQKWIYTQRPRKPFSRNRKNSFSAIPSDSPREPHLDGFENISASGRKELSKERKINWRIYRATNSLIVILIVAFAVLFIINQLHPFYTATKPLETISKDQLERYKAFNLSMEYGMNSLDKGDYNQAIKEFKNAQNIEPLNQLAFYALAKSYYLSCLSNDEYCDDAIQAYSSIINENPTKEYYKIRSELFIHTGNFELADKDIERLTD